MLFARVENMLGGNLWNNNGRSEGYRDVPNIGSKYMKEYIFKEFKYFLSCLWADPSKERTDDWWQIISLENLFAENQKKMILSSNLKILNESMSAFRPQTRATGNLLHLSHNLCKPEDLGTEFKNLACAQIYVMLCIKICQSMNDPSGCEFIDEYKKNYCLLHAASQKKFSASRFKGERTC